MSSNSVKLIGQTLLNSSNYPISSFGLFKKPKLTSQLGDTIKCIFKTVRFI